MLQGSEAKYSPHDSVVYWGKLANIAFLLQFPETFYGKNTVNIFLSIDTIIVVMTYGQLSNINVFRYFSESKIVFIGIEWFLLFPDVESAGTKKRYAAFIQVLIKRGKGGRLIYYPLARWKSLRCKGGSGEFNILNWRLLYPPLISLWTYVPLHMRLWMSLYYIPSIVMSLHESLR